MRVIPPGQFSQRRRELVYFAIVTAASLVRVFEREVHHKKPDSVNGKSRLM